MEKKYRYKIIIEYVGTCFVGWQRQQNGLSVQEVIESAILEFTKENVVIYAAGRTDSGVHALGQVVHFDLSREYDPYKLMASINHFVRPHAISVVNCDIVDETFHARFSAQKRHYKYIILNRESNTVLHKDRMWHIHDKLDVDKMIQAAQILIGKHDFSSFRAKECQSASPVKTLDKIDIIVDGDFITFEISAKSFLHHMVRNIMGTLKSVGDGKINPEVIRDILLAKDRSAAGITAPAAGLYFVKVDY